MRKITINTVLVALFLLFFNLPTSAQPANQVNGNAGSCDFSDIEAKDLALEGEDVNNPDRKFLNLKMKYEPGPKQVINGKERTSVIIREQLQIGFFRNWLSEGVSGLAAQVNSALPDSCSMSRGATSARIESYSPMSFSIHQLMTKRQCTSFDQPCGLPETTCTGGSPGSAPTCSLPSCGWSGCHGGGCSGGSLPQLPTCVTKTKMCRAEQKVDVFSADIGVTYQLPLAVQGEPPTQKIEIQSNIIKNDINTSQGELTKLLNDIGLAGVLGVRMSTFSDGIRAYVNTTLQAMRSPAQYFPIPTSDYIYLPTVRRNEDVQWVSLNSSRPGAAPFGLQIVRDMALTTSLACRVSECLRKSKKANQLLIKSCSF
jgi:hypothetical protein